ncbi:hypothetical protein MBS99_09620 [Ligilactobacillus salivarius]|nr:hypothetical protein [Ligilactobacillus salivarius]MDE7523128.1 hypothetical protein [Ligilactobacillus salivarius]UHL93621.1 hypothetical protein LVD18_04765 [Ligilactobacillus salivarius]
MDEETYRIKKETLNE